jgi:hypothetical protein
MTNRVLLLLTSAAGLGVACNTVVAGTCHPNEGAGGGETIPIGAGVGATTGDFISPPKGPLSSGDDGSDPCLQAEMDVYECKGYVWCENVKPVQGDPAEVRKEIPIERIEARNETHAARQIIDAHAKKVRAAYPNSKWTCDGTLRCKPYKGK